MAATTGPTARVAVTSEHDLLATPNRRLDALFRVTPAGPVPTGVLDGVAILFPGNRSAGRWRRSSGHSRGRAK